MSGVVGMSEREEAQLATGVRRADAEGLAGQLGQLARDLHGHTGVEETLDEIVRTALRLLPRAESASISMVKARQQVESRAASGELPRVVDAIQTQTGQGPCLDAAYREQIVRVPDLSRELRWPRFAHRAWEAGARSMLSVQFFLENRDRGRGLGALNLYGAEVGVFEEECEQVAVLVATHAAIALADAKEITGLTDALVNRDLIGQAKGVLMERYKLSTHEAFVLLTAAATTTNRKLTDIAEELVLTGHLATHTKGQQGNAG
ncbi:GAF and ANTAR domain-containing protein [Arthrobacter sp. MDT2-16]